jgi:hypothetical protein
MSSVRALGNMNIRFISGMQKRCRLNVPRLRKKGIAGDISIEVGSNQARLLKEKGEMASPLFAILESINQTLESGSPGEISA